MAWYKNVGATADRASFRDDRGTASKEQREYLGHLDGLRAVALLGVLLYHFELLGHTGGFVGVDVFLVISGFLMTRNILAKVRTGSFDLRAFYRTRFWRLYPSSLFTVLVSVTAARVLLPTSLASDAAKSALASMFLSSNVFFSQETGGYFDAGAVAKPLLHTWSLSLEEQFYFFWPILLVSLGSAIRKQPQRMLAILGAAAGTLFAASFVTCLSVAARNPVIAWFWLHTRVYEFAIGALALVFYDALPGNALLQELYAATGLAAILVSYITMSDETPFPGWASLPALLGAATVIATPRAALLGRVLSSWTARWLAKLSYAGYLVHWPLWVFVVYLTGQRDFGLECMLTTFFLAFLQLELIEDPLRFPTRSSRRLSFRAAFVAACFCAALVVSALTVRSVSQDEQELRSLLAGEIEPIAKYEPVFQAKEPSVAQTRTEPVVQPRNDSGALRSNLREIEHRELQVPPLETYLKRSAKQRFECEVIVSDDMLAPFYLRYVVKADENQPLGWLKTPSAQLNNALLHFAKAPFVRDDEVPDVVMLGDSHTQNYIYGLYLVTRRYNLRTVSYTHGGCGYLIDLGDIDAKRLRTDEYAGCVRAQRAVKKLLSEMRRPAVVVVAFHWAGKHIWKAPNSYEQKLTAVFEWIVSFGHRVLIMGAVPHPRYNPLHCLERRGKLGGPSECDVWVEPHESSTADLKVLQRIASNLSAHAETRGAVRVVDVFPVLCRSSAECRAIDQNGNALYYDGAGHMTRHGQTLTIEPLATELKRALKLS